MRTLMQRSGIKVELCGTHSSWLFRRRLTSHGDVKRTQCAGRSQNRQLMRGGRA
jgi:hypothetical protein